MTVKVNTKLVPHHAVSDLRRVDPRVTPRDERGQLFATMLKEFRKSSARLAPVALFSMIVPRERIFCSKIQGLAEPFTV